MTPQVGLFRGVSDNPKGQPATPRDGIVFRQEHDGVEVQFRASGQLDATDWRHFLAVAALAGIDGQRFNGGSGEDLLPDLWSRFVAEGVASRKDGVRLRTTAYAVLREAGLTDTGPNRTRLTETLMRLSSVRQFIRKGNRVMSGANLLSFAHDEETGELSIGLSPQMARTVLGESKQFVRINLEDVRSLRDSAAVILHAVLSARLRPGDRRPAVYHIDTLATAAFGPTENASTKRNRRPKVREALTALTSLPQWRTAQQGDRVCIWRSDAPRRWKVGMSEVAAWLEETADEAGEEADDTPSEADEYR